MAVQLLDLEAIFLSSSSSGYERLREADIAQLLADPAWPKIPTLAHTVKDPVAAQRIGGLLEERLRDNGRGMGFECEGWLPYVTTGRAKHAIGWHTDKLENMDIPPDPRVTHKVLVYLNEPRDEHGRIRPGGSTFFRWRDGTETDLWIVPRAGDVLLFALDLEHRGEPQPKGFEKFTLGLWPIAPRLVDRP